MKIGRHTRDDRVSYVRTAGFVMPPLTGGRRDLNREDIYVRGGLCLCNDQYVSPGPSEYGHIGSY